MKKWHSITSLDEKLSDLVGILQNLKFNENFSVDIIFL